MGVAAAPALVRPEAGQVDLWLLEPERIRSLAALAPSSLDPGQLERAAGMGEPGRREHWSGRQVALRTALGSYLGLAAREVPLRRRPGGKPELAGYPDLHFSVSVTEGWWLAAFSGLEVGVDVEAVRGGVDLDLVAGTYFNEAELACLAAVPDQGGRRRRAYQVWTRKEARLKLSGLGLTGLEALREAGQADPVWVEDLDLHPFLAASLALARRPESYRLIAHEFWMR